MKLPIKLTPSNDLRRVLKAYASLHNRSLENYVMDLIVDGLSGEAHARMDLTQVPEVMERGGPKLSRGDGVLSSDKREPDSEFKRYDSRGLASRMGLSRFRIGEIKRANSWLASQGKEPLIFQGRYSTVRRVSEWLDQHPDWKKLETRKPEPPPGSPIPPPNQPTKRPKADRQVAYTKEEFNALRRFARSKHTAAGARNVHGGFAVAHIAGLDHELTFGLRCAGFPSQSGGWIKVNELRDWVRENIEILAPPLDPPPSPDSSNPNSAPADAQGDEDSNSRWSWS